MPYWIVETLATTPAFAWVYLGVGVPWALSLLPRGDWRRLPMVLAAAFMLGPAWLTAWMFILGTLGAQTQTALLRADLILVGTVVIAAVGGVITASRRRPKKDSTQYSVLGTQDASAEYPKPGTQNSEPRTRLDFDERLLIGLIAVAWIVRWFVTAYWPFIAYDTLWVYGYQGRLYTLLGYIPNSIDYYPQFLSLQYAFGQIIYGGINDHAARAVIPFINLGSSLAVYTLGAKLFSRRAGIYAAAIWTLYPHVGEWSRMGDLEIVLTTAFTLASAFFLLAWTRMSGEDAAAAPPSPGLHTRCALLAGLMLGIGLWTKPTMGAFVWGAALLVGIASVGAWRGRAQGRVFPLRARAALMVMLAAVPLGGVWYVRNLLLGYRAIDFPPDFWLTQAMRSGAEFGWPLLALAVATAYALFGVRDVRVRRAYVIAGWLLILGGVLPSILQPRRMELIEWGVMAVGCWLLAVGYRQLGLGEWRTRLTWLLLLALPYFVTWFWSYSYHYRLSFAIVPLLLMPTAVILAAWKERLWSTRQAGSDGRVPRARSVVATGLVIALAIPGIVMPFYDTYTGWDTLWSGALPDDSARQRSGNQALLNVVDGLQVYEETEGRPPVVAAPGVQTLPFFMPHADIRIEDAPTRLDDLEGVTYFVDSHPQATGAYQGIPITQNQVLGALYRQDIMRRAWGMDDGIFRYDVYALDLARRWQPPQPGDAETREVILGGFTRFVGNDLGGLEFWAGRPVVLTLYFQARRASDVDYSIFVHLRDDDGNLIAAFDGPVALNTVSSPIPRYYSTLVWDAGEYVTEARTLRLESIDAPLGPGYMLVMGLYAFDGGARAPIMIDGVPAGDTYLIDDRIVLRAPPGGE